jgi:glycosyltransferase involved in cell wall biosynthesis
MIGKIQVIPNGLNTSHLPTKLREFDSTAFNIAHVAGFSFEKNHLALLRIFKLIQDQIPSAKLWLVGDGPLKTSIEKDIENMNLRNVHFTGSVINPLDYISSASVLVLPSIIEGLPGVILEAMYCKTPVVAYNVGGISEVVKSGKTGWLVKAGDESGFVASIKEVFEADQQLLNQIKANAYEMVLNHFDNRVIAQRFLEVYRKL